jgi:uncharacterized membrane protein YozB (DUF420 family)
MVKQNRLKKPKPSLNDVLAKAYMGMTMGVTTLMMTVNTAFAADIWTEFKDMMTDIYNKLLGVTTIIAVVLIVLALIIRMTGFGNQKATDQATAWIKRIAVSWFIINTLGFIIAYVQPLVAGGQWSES